jgi:hypothetical protein
VNRKASRVAVTTTSNVNRLQATTFVRADSPIGASRPPSLMYVGRPPP